MDRKDEKVRSLGRLDDLGLCIHANCEVAGRPHRQVYNVAGPIEVRDDQVAALELQHGPSDANRSCVVRYRCDLFPAAVVSLARRLLLGEVSSVRDATVASRGRRRNRAVCRDVEREVAVPSKGVHEDVILTWRQRIAQLHAGVRRWKAPIAPGIGQGLRCRPSGVRFTMEQGPVALASLYDDREDHERRGVGLVPSVAKGKAEAALSADKIRSGRGLRSRRGWRHEASSLSNSVSGADGPRLSARWARGADQNLGGRGRA